MDIVFKKTDKDIQSIRCSHFLHHLYSEVLNRTAVEILVRILDKSDVFVFSGVIRDYFVDRRKQHRDLDLVLEHNINWLPIYRSYRKQINVKINSYGGFKVRIGELNVDVWTMERTWGLMKKGVKITPRNLIRTAFFNFSAITYSIRHQRFYAHSSFIDFLNNPEIGIVYKENPNIPLCILNSMHYGNILKMPLSMELKKWILTHYSMFDDYRTPQMRHWGKAIYNQKEIRAFISQCERGV